MSNTPRLCKHCGVKPVARPEWPSSLYCGEECVILATAPSSDDGYDAYRDAGMNTYDRRDWQWGSWDT